MTSLTSFYFNGRSSSEFPWLVVNSIKEDVLPPIEQKTAYVPGRPGLYLLSKQKKERRDTIDITIIADSKAQRAQYKRILAEWLDTDDAQEFYYSYEPDKKYEAILDGSTKLTRVVTDGTVSLTFLIPDPDAYGENKEQNIDGSRITVTEDSQEDWEAGTLSDLEATAGGDLQLVKAGSDYSGAVDIGWESGTHVNTVERDNDRLELDTVAPDEFYLSGYRDSVAITAMRSAGRVASTSFSWIDNKPAGTSVKAYTQISLDDGANWSSWKEVSNGGAIPDLPAGTDISQISFRYRFELTTSNPTVTPSVDRAEYKFFAGHKASGYRISPPISVDRIETAGESFIGWDGTPNESPNIQVDVQLVDEGDPPDPDGWLPATNEGEIPGLIKGSTDLTGKELYVRQTLFSPNATSTPVLHLLTWWIDMNVSKSVHHLDTDISSFGISTLPSYSFREGFSDYSASGWSVIAGDLSQEDGYISIQKETTGEGTQIIISRADQALTAPYTIDFRIRTDTAWTGFMFCVDAANRYDVALPSTSGEWEWMRLVVGESSATLYHFGNSTSPYSPYSPSVAGGYNSLGFAIYNADTGTLDIDAIYISPSDLGAPEETSWSATSLPEQVPFGSVDIANSGEIDWAWTPTTATVDPNAQSASLEYRISPDGVTWSSWTPVASGSPVAIPEITQGSEWGSGAVIEYRATITTTDPGYSPQVDQVSIDIESQLSGNALIYLGSAPSFPQITVNFQEAVADFEILHLESGNKVIVNRDFNPGDVLEIDCATEKIMVNGSLAMPSLSIMSDFFSLSPGLNTIITSPAGASIATLEWKERWK